VCSARLCNKAKYVMANSIRALKVYKSFTKIGSFSFFPFIVLIVNCFILTKMYFFTVVQLLYVSDWVWFRSLCNGPLDLLATTGGTQGLENSPSQKKTCMMTQTEFFFRAFTANVLYCSCQVC